VNHRVCPGCNRKKAHGAKTCRICRQELGGYRTHGLSYTSEYRAWQTMRLRCTVPANPAYESYGGRGITVCAGWLASVEKFVAEMGPKPSKSHELDRERNDDGYWCGNCEECIALGRRPNCRWVTRKVNDRNRRSSRNITAFGETRTLAEWCELRSLPWDTIAKRLDAGWDAERALSAPVRRKAINGTAKSRAA
jgi:hypothetical protein